MRGSFTDCMQNPFYGELAVTIVAGSEFVPEVGGFTIIYAPIFPIPKLWARVCLGGMHQHRCLVKTALFGGCMPYL